VNRLLLTNTTVMGAAASEFWQANPQYPSEQWRDLLPLIESGAIDPPIGQVMPLTQTAAALRLLDDRRAIGRVLIRVRER
jgi:NADPH:quinone reductase